MNTDSLRALWKTVFGDTDAFLDNFFRIAYSPDRCRFIEENGDAICVLYWFDCSYSGGKLAYIYAVATHPQHRGKGLASQLLQQTHEQLKQMGYAGAVLKPAKGLFPFYKRLGYVTSGFIRRFYEKASTVPTDLTELTPEAYGRRRQAFLPPDAIIQDGIFCTVMLLFMQPVMRWSVPFPKRGLFLNTWEIPIPRRAFWLL